MNPIHHPSLELQIKLKKIGFTNCETVTDTCGNYIRHTPGFDTGEYNPCPNVMEMLVLMGGLMPTMATVRMGYLKGEYEARFIFCTFRPRSNRRNQEKIFQ